MAKVKKSLKLCFLQICLSVYSLTGGGVEMLNVRKIMANVLLIHCCFVMAQTLPGHLKEKIEKVSV